MRVLVRWSTPPSGRGPVLGHQSWWVATSRRVRISGVRQRTLLGPLTVASTSDERWPTTPVLPQCPRGDPYFRSAVCTHGTLLFWWLHPASREGGPLSRARARTNVGFTRLASRESRRVAPRHGAHTSGSWGGRCVGKLGFCVRCMRFGVMPALYSALTKPQTPPGFRRSEGFPRVFPVRARFALSRWPGSVRG